MNTLPTLNNIQDVNVTAPATNDVLVYTSGEWKNNPAVAVQQIFIALAGQTGFGPLATPYVPGEGQLSVYINGIKQYPGTFTETTPTTFVLSSASQANDEILAEVSSLTLPVVQPAMPLHGYKEIFTSTAGQTVIGPLAVPYDVGQGQLNVTINGIRMFPAAFTESSSTTITMNSPLTAGEVILVEHIYGAALPGPIPGVLDDLNDVVITSPATNNTLVYNGTNWVNGPAPSGGGGGSGDRIVTTDTNGDTLTLAVEAPKGIRAWHTASYDNAVTNILSMSGGTISIGENTPTASSGYGNVIIGDAAMQYGGDRCVAIGSAALQYASYPIDAVAIGYHTSGPSFGVVIGSGAMQSSTSGVTAGCVAIGQAALEYCNSAANTAVGRFSQQYTDSGSENTSFGYETLRNNTSGSYGTAIGFNALVNNTTGDGNVAVGYNAMRSNTVGNDCVAVGYESLYSNTTGYGNVAVGYDALYSNVNGGMNIAIGNSALFSCDGNENIAIGSSALNLSYQDQENVAIGRYTLNSHRDGDDNTALGTDALRRSKVSQNNTAVGALAATSIGNTAIPALDIVSGRTYMVNQAYDTDFTAVGALNNIYGTVFVATGVPTGSGTVFAQSEGVTAVGYSSLYGDSTTRRNVTALGAYTVVTGDNQVQLGNSATTTYAFGAIQDRSDARDKADIRDTVLGLDFINQLHPVDFRWDYRQDYTTVTVIPGTDKDHPDTVETVHAIKDGSKKRNRYHHGLIAQEVKQVLDATGVDFGGYQDHSMAGGDDVLSIGYTELIAPLIKAVQELSTIVKSNATEISELRSALASIQQGNP